MNDCEDCPDYGYEELMQEKQSTPVVINSDRHIVGQIVRHESTTPQSTDSANEKR